MAEISDEILQELRERIDIVDLMNRYVQLRRTGKNYSTRCPFHQEKTASFFVNPQRKSFKCFGCGVWGDGIDFVMRMEGTSFTETLHKLAEIYGVRLPAALRRGKSAQRVERDEALAINHSVTEIYRELLLHQPQGAAGREYLAARGIALPTAELFQLGYAPTPSEAGWDFLARELAARHHSLELAETLGLIAARERANTYYDKFRGRLIFPIIHPGGTIIGFSGRILPQYTGEKPGQEAPKYINSPESTLYQKGKALFGLHIAKTSIYRSERAILVEGNFDVVAMHQRGYSETVAPLGTALTSEQAQLLGRFTNRVVLCFDGDNAGRKAMSTAISTLLDADMETLLIELDQGYDPDSMEQERLRNLFEQPQAALEWMIRRLAAKGANDSIDARVRAIEYLAPFLAKVRRTDAQTLYVDYAAKLLHLSPTQIWAILRRKPKETQQLSAPPDLKKSPSTPKADLPREQADLAALLVDNPHLANIAERLDAQKHIKDQRLQPIVSAVLDAAKKGTNPTEGELLQLIDESDRRHVHDLIFTGMYRDTELDPQQILLACLHLCEEADYKHERERLEQEIQQALQRGDQERARLLSLERLQLNQQLAKHRKQHPRFQRT